MTSIYNTAPVHPVSGFFLSPTHRLSPSNSPANSLVFLPFSLQLPPQLTRVRLGRGGM